MVTAKETHLVNQLRVRCLASKRASRHNRFRAMACRRRQTGAETLESLAVAPLTLSNPYERLPASERRHVRFGEHFLRWLARSSPAKVLGCF